MAKHSSPRRQRGRAALGRIGPTLGGVIDLDGRTWLLAAVIVAICLLPVGLLYWLQPSSMVSTLTYTLRITPITSGIPLIHVRIEDPLKRDGQRVRGY